MAEAAVHLDEGGTEIVLGGPRYVELLAGVHRRLRPRTYFEIGARRGSSLRVAGCTSLVVDPHFQLEEGVVGPKPICTLHQSTSDEFFATRDPIGILGAPIDLAFIDGMHQLEFVLRDFIGTERSVSPGSMIVLDDICPRDYYMSRRTFVPDAVQPTKYKGYWTGDVWKMIPILREYRPAMDVRCIDTQPTGLAVCTNLDPSDETLATNYDEIVLRWRDVRLEDYGLARLLEDLRMVSADAWVNQLVPLYPDDPEPPAEGSRFRSQNEILRAQMDAMRKSTSWRITRPLRFLGRLARKS
ncbi:MAG: class I SAM-dependent methyltransferase [Chloroflexota bacterium]